MVNLKKRKFFVKAMLFFALIFQSNFSWASELREDQKLFNELEDSGFEFPNGMIKVGTSWALVLKKVQEVAKSKASVLILGETGVGKAFIAKSIFKNSNRKDAPFLLLNGAQLSS